MCGRDIFDESIVSEIPKELIGKHVLVQNENDENLGLGIVKVGGSRITIKNVIDRGDFLRREK